MQTDATCWAQQCVACCWPATVASVCMGLKGEAHTAKKALRDLLQDRCRCRNQIGTFLEETKTNSLLNGVPKCVLKKLQYFQNFAARHDVYSYVKI